MKGLKAVQLFKSCLAPRPPCLVLCVQTVPSFLSSALFFGSEIHGMLRTNFSLTEGKEGKETRKNICNTNNTQKSIFTAYNAYTLTLTFEGSRRGTKSFVPPSGWL